MQGSVYNYERQEWDQIDTDTDEHCPEHGERVFKTANGTLYEVHPSAPMYKPFALMV